MNLITTVFNNKYYNIYYNKWNLEGVFIGSLNVIFYKPDIAVKLYKCHDFK